MGATHILDRNLSPSDLGAEIQKITPKPVKYVFDAVSLPATAKIAYDILAPGGYIVYVLPDVVVDETKIHKDKKIIYVQGFFWAEDSREVGASFFNALPGLLEAGEIKVCIVKCYVSHPMDLFKYRAAQQN